MRIVFPGHLHDSFHKSVTNNKKPCTLPAFQKLCMLYLACHNLSGPHHQTMLPAFRLINYFPSYCKLEPHIIPLDIFSPPNVSL